MNPATIYQAKRGARALCVLVVPITVVFFARYFFNNTIETNLIDYNFISPSQAYAMNPIPAVVISSLYNFGFAFCATMTLCAAVILSSGRIIWIQSHPNWLLWLMIGGWFVISVWVFCRLAFYLPDCNSYCLPSSISQKLIDPLKNLPVYENNLGPSRHSIGNTGTSLMQIVVPGFALIAVAAVSYLLALASVVLNQQDTQLRMQVMANLTMLVSVTFMMTVVATHLLFQPVADMIAEAYPSYKSAGAAAAQSFAHLRNAMTLYWATIFSLALATAYFTARISIGPDENASTTGLWRISKEVLAVLSPLITGGVLQLGTAIIDALPTQ